MFKKSFKCLAAALLFALMTFSLIPAALPASGAEAGGYVPIFGLSKMQQVIGGSRRTEHLYYYVNSKDEADLMVEQGCRNEGIVCYVLESSQRGSVPLYRLEVNNDYKNHFLTTNETEQDVALAQRYKSATILGYCFTSDRPGPSDCAVYGWLGSIDSARTETGAPTNNYYYDTNEAARTSLTWDGLKFRAFASVPEDDDLGSVSKYNVRFNANGGTGTMADQPFDYDQFQPLQANAFTRAGYTFAGWATSPTGAVLYNDKQILPILTNVKSSVVNLYAVWTNNYSYTVRFNANGGTGTMSDQSFTFGVSQALQLNTFTRAGYSFAGWASYPQGGKVYNNGQAVSDLHNVNGAVVNLYAVWINTFTVRFNANGGTGTMADQTFTYGQSQALRINNFTRAGYTFTGWATLPGGAKEYNNGQAVAHLSGVGGAVVNLYAVWSANQYTVRFNANGGTGTMANQPFAYGQSLALRPNTFTRVGYAFAGWATSPAGAKVYDNGQSVSNLTATNNAVVDLYTVWSVNQYTVRFNAYGGTGTMASQPFTYGQSQVLRANTFTRTGYVFIGWAASAAGAKVYDNGQSVSNLSASNNAVIDLYAVWGVNYYAVRFNAVGGSGSAAAKGSSHIQVFTYNQSQALSANIFTRLGCTFSGWASSPAGAKVYNDKQTVSNLTSVSGAIVDLYSVWTINTYTARFYANGGSGTMADQNFVCFESQKLRLNSFTRSGHRFVGWSTSPNGIIEYSNEQPLILYPTVSGTVVNLYARWAKYQATVNTHFDRGYNTWYGESEPISRGILSGYVKEISNPFYNKVGLQLTAGQLSGYVSPIDICKGTVASGNIDTLCTHSGIKHTDRPNVIASFKSLFPGSSTITNCYWSGHRIQSVSSAGQTQYNRCCSSGNCIFMINRETVADRKDNTKMILLHELSHQYGALDHYHEIDKDGKCKFKERCSECGINPRSGDCIMACPGIKNLNLTTTFCNACVQDLLKHLDNHHKY